MTTAEAAPDRHATTARLAILAAALLFSTGGAAIKATALTGWQVACFRSGVAALAVLAMLSAARRGWSAFAWLVGSAYAATMILYVLGNKLTTAANTIFLQATAPLYLALIGPWLLKEPIRRRDVGLMAAIAAALALFLAGGAPATRTAPDPAAGNLLAAGSGLTWALAVAGLRMMGRRGGHGGGVAAAVVAGNVLAFAAAFPFALPVAVPRPEDVAIVLFLGVVQIGLAYVLLTYGLGHVPAFEASLLLLVEPVMNPVWAWLVQGERPAPAAIVAGVLIVGATAANVVLGSRRRIAG